MDPEIQRRFEEFDARLSAAERRVLTTGNLVSKVGIPSLVEAQMKIDALMESDTRLYGALQQLAEFHQQLADSQRQLAESQRKITESHRELAESHRKTDEELRRLSATVQAFIESLRKGGNGSKS